ncbi:YbaB/EbfC family DNA-binding protein [Burkholderia anthina]|uniref:YbaB/EbfC family DNA-binding protein n=1 Tax=Burkholderia anthina TaxID=179879 RepID=UPI001CF39164|nr:YbaB/EbfC family DNA-binding protein [Burkholderia anthina]MCA8094025.1 YbaB/EbfC family DNA-binding protein [Burkholderia anthina]
MKRRLEWTVSGWLRTLAFVCGLAACAPAVAQTADVPQPWISYAQFVGRQFQAWLEADGDAPDRLHQYLEERVLKASAEAPPPAIVVRAWIGPNGAVMRVEFTSLGAPDADATLRQLLTANPLTELPPPDMLQPLRVRLRLTPNPDAAAAAPASARSFMRRSRSAAAGSGASTAGAW